MINLLIKKLQRLSWALLIAFLLAPDSQASDETHQISPMRARPGGYSIKASDVLLPAGVKLGQYQRVIRPYDNWTLVCDEDLEEKQRLCNITQSFVDELGKTIFSWSLAASQGGVPVLILRAPLQVGPSGSVSLDLQDGGEPLNAAIKGCAGGVCIAYQAVNARVSRAISNGYVAILKFKRQDAAQPVAIDAPLSGLDKALSGI